MTPFFFQVKLECDETSGDLLAAYFRIRKGKVHETREFSDGAAFADYNKKGELIGIELLGPCRVSIVDQLAANEPVALRSKTKEFMRKNCPRPLIAV